MIPWYIVKYYLHKHSKFCSCLAVLLLFTVCFYSYLQLFLVVWSFLLGIAGAYSFISSDSTLPNLLFMFKRNKKEGNIGDDELTLMKTMCTVCGQRKCPRHRPELNILAFQPWTNLELRGKVDEAVEEFLSIVLKEYVYTWYRDVSADEGFVDELRTNLRFLVSVFLRRAKKIDIPQLVSEKLVKAGLQHLHVYLQAKKSAPPGTDLQQLTLDYLGPHLHCAMQSRKAELEYLRRMVEAIFPFILNPQGLKSKCTCSLAREILSGSILLPALDAIANPDMVNNILLIFLDDTPPPSATEPPSPMVNFLEKYSRTSVTSNSCLHHELNDIIGGNNPSLLYTFMQFLKREAAVNVLQFCLACDDFNKQVLNPELSQSALVELHNHAKDLYRCYCAKNAPDKIKFDEEIVSELKDILEGPPEQVIRLRTSTPLFKAYEHAYNLLEQTFIPLFHQSEEYYEMLCGSRVMSQTSRNTPSNQLAPRQPNNSRMPKKKEFGLSNIGHKIKGVFKSTAEMRSLPEMDNFEDADTVTIASCSSLDDEIPECMAMEGSFQEFTLPDLSTWRVTIPRIGARPDPENNKKQYFVFIIDVRRVDLAHNMGTRGVPAKESWVVARRYPEFYVLESKLLEFHGELLADCPLPAKRSFGTGKQDFIENKRDTFEIYLQKLLTKPFLKGSQLLYTFLTTDHEFTTGFLPDINLGKMFKAGAMKLVKEKGQHLDPFLWSFVQSTEVPKPKSSKLERRGSDVSLKSTSSEKLCCSLYENNANYSSDSIASSQTSSLELDFSAATGQQESKDRQDVEGVFDALIYLARYVYSIPDWFHHVMMTSRILFKLTLENYLEWYIQQKVAQVTQEHRIVSLVHLLRDVLFSDTDRPRTDEQKKERFEQTLAGCLDFIPKPFVSVVGRSNHENGTKLILEVLQQPKLNKQLSYVFLDIIVQELFPELRG
ncbi:sorting nexin-14-like isoform X2 [Mizuhopecten yessoensis]|uniref:Sorting nexin-14 n=1 Tax=Mizuhopecten yessoensis TaxID=6573 RepID=A0A210R1K0_MIZYE|nr:sorting nexin-14-like isoform X2 [Mizuhopecten yessoensis]OWF54898.1 Sorting nexin-14 [Mizuhopecten yessoensis]